MISLPQADVPFRLFLAVFATAALLLLYLVQNFNYGAWLFEVIGMQCSSVVIFSANKTIRFLLNDIFTILVIYAIFYSKRHVVLAIWVQIFGFVFLLIPYIFLRLFYLNSSYVLTSFLHRLIINPVLLLVLIAAFFHQQLTTNKPRHLK